MKLNKTFSLHGIAILLLSISHYSKHEKLLYAKNRFRYKPSQRVDNFRLLVLQITYFKGYKGLSIMNEPKNWLITGGAGFIGRNLLANLIGDEKSYVRIIDNLKIGSRKDLQKVCQFRELKASDLSNSLNRIDSIDSSSTYVVELVVADILDQELALKACMGFDVIVHLAANTGVAPSVENPRMDCETYVIGTLNYLEAARHCKVNRFIFASSGAPCGKVDPPIHEEITPHPVSPYGSSKLAGEGYCSAYYKTFGLDTVCLRFGNVYGPRSHNKDSVIAKFIKQAIAGKTVEIYGDGNQTRDFIHVNDLIRAIRLAAVKPNIGGEIFQIATSKENTINDLVNMLKRRLEDKHQIHMSVKYAQPRLGDVKRNYSDTTKAKQLLGWRSEIALDSGIEQTIAEFVS